MITKSSVSNKLEENNLLKLSFQSCNSALQGLFELHLFLHVSLCFPPQCFYPFQLCLSLIHLPLQSLYSQSKLQQVQKKLRSDCL